ncbi:MAG: MarR family transcriptional regulator [Halovenus sp.]
MTVERDGLDSLSPSCKLVHRVLIDVSDERLTVNEIVEETGLTRRTVQRSLAALEEIGLVDRQPSTEDARQTVVTFTGK